MTPDETLMQQALPHVEHGAKRLYDGVGGYLHREAAEKLAAALRDRLAKPTAALTDGDILRALEGLECYERCTGLRSVVAPVLRDRLARPVVPLCGAPAVGGLCVLPAGHNRGRADVPQNHSAAPAPVPLTDERLRFEEWLHSQHIDVPRLCDAGSYRAGEYESTDIEDWWAVWQARAAHGIGGER